MVEDELRRLNALSPETVFAFICQGPNWKGSGEIDLASWRKEDISELRRRAEVELDGPQPPMGPESQTKIAKPTTSGKAPKASVDPIPVGPPEAAQSSDEKFFGWLRKMHPDLMLRYLKDLVRGFWSSQGSLRDLLSAIIGIHTKEALMQHHRQTKMMCAKLDLHSLHVNILSYSFDTAYAAVEILCDHPELMMIPENPWHPSTVCEQMDNLRIKGAPSKRRTEMFTSALAISLAIRLPLLMQIRNVAHSESLFHMDVRRSARDRLVTMYTHPDDNDLEECVAVQSSKELPRHRLKEIKAEDIVV